MRVSSAMITRWRSPSANWSSIEIGPLYLFAEGGPVFGLEGAHRDPAPVAGGVDVVAGVAAEKALFAARRAPAGWRYSSPVAPPAGRSRRRAWRHRQIDRAWSYRAPAGPAGCRSPPERPSGQIADLNAGNQGRPVGIADQLQHSAHREIVDVLRGELASKGPPGRIRSSRCKSDPLFCFESFS